MNCTPGQSKWSAKKAAEPKVVTKRSTFFPDFMRSTILLSLTGDSAMSLMAPDQASYMKIHIL